MPWTPRDSYSHTKKANTSRLQQLWSRVANAALAAGDDEGTAIAKASAAVQRASGPSLNGRRKIRDSS